MSWCAGYVQGKAILVFCRAVCPDHLVMPRCPESLHSRYLQLCPLSTVNRHCCSDTHTAHTAHTQHMQLVPCASLASCLLPLASRLLPLASCLMPYACHSNSTQALHLAGPPFVLGILHLPSNLGPTSSLHTSPELQAKCTLLCSSIMLSRGRCRWRLKTWWWMA